MNSPIKCRLTARAALLLALLALPTVRAQTPTEPLTRYSALMAGIGSDAQIFLNGFPLFVGEAGEQRSRSELLNRFLKAGQNRMLVQAMDFGPVVPPPPEDEDPVFPSVQLRVLVETLAPQETEAQLFFQLDRIYSFTASESFAGREGIEVKTADWDSEHRSNMDDLGRSLASINLSLRSAHYRQVQQFEPHQVEVLFELEDFPVVDLPWQAPFTAPDAAAIQLMRDQVMAIHAAFAARDMGALLTLMRPKLERMAVSLGITTDTVGAALAQTYQDLVFSIAGLATEPLLEADLTFEQVSGLNLLEARANGLPPLRAASPEFEFDLRLFFSAVAGEWVLVE